MIIRLNDKVAYQCECGAKTDFCDSESILREHIHWERDLVEGGGWRQGCDVDTHICNFCRGFYGLIF